MVARSWTTHLHSSTTAALLDVMEGAQLVRVISKSRQACQDLSVLVLLILEDVPLLQGILEEAEVLLCRWQGICSTQLCVMHVTLHVIEGRCTHD